MGNFTRFHLTYSWGFILKEFLMHTFCWVLTFTMNETFLNHAWATAAKKGWFELFRVHCEKYGTAKLHFWLFLNELRQSFFWSFAWVSAVGFGLVLPVFSKNNHATGLFFACQNTNGPLKQRPTMSTSVCCMNEYWLELCLVKNTIKRKLQIDGKKEET